MSNKPAEISQIIKEQIRQYHNRIEMTETGSVILVGDGIARVYGLRGCMAGELLEFDDGSVGLAQNLEEESGGLWSQGSQRVELDLATEHACTCMST